MEFLRMTAREYRNMLNKGTTNKYGAEKTTVDGVTFDSKYEAKKSAELELLQKAGKIKELERQKRFILQDGFINNKKERVRPISYIADFFYYDVKLKQYVVMDAKGVETEVFRIKKKLFEKRYPEYLFVVAKK